MCDCLKNLQDRLAGEPKLNTVFDVPHIINVETGEDVQPKFKIATLKRDPRNRTSARTIVAVFCPFCGEKYAQ